MDQVQNRGRPRSFDCGEVLDQAMAVFWKQGFAGTSYSDLTAATGLNKPSLYAAFGDKAQLFAKVLNRYNAGPNARALEAFAASPSFLSGVGDLLNSFADFYSAPGAAAGCLVLTALSESSTPDFPPGLHAQLVEAAQSSQKVVAARVNRARDTGELAAEADVEGIVGFITTFGLGIAAAAKAGATRDTQQAAIDCALKLFRDGIERSKSVKGLA
jgi:AcrR family transcriptional regulator